MKTVYEAPVQEIVAFEIEDIITTSAQSFTTLPTMGDAGDSDSWKDGDRIDFSDLLGKN